MKPLEKAEALLEDLLGLAWQLEELENSHERELQEVSRKFWSRHRELQYWYESVERDLLSLMKAHKEEIFGASDKVSLPQGALLRGVEERLSLPRDALQRVEAAGWLEAVRVSKSLERSVVEAWPPERLAAIGARLRRREVFVYELYSFPAKRRKP